jgi:predicted ATPase
MNSLPLLRLLADACRAHCLRTKGLETVEKALAIARETEMVFDEPELWRLKGELLLLDPAISPAAEEALTRAIESASTQGTKMWELRATVSLARLWRQQGREELARCKLEKLYSWFEEGFETADLRKARDLLDEVGVGDAERCHSLASG